MYRTMSTRKRPRNITYHLYRLQQQIALTNREAKALGVLLFFMLLGIAARAYQQNQPTLAPEFYNEADSLFLEATRLMKEQEAALNTATDSTASKRRDTTQLTPAIFTPSFPININTASATDLERLPRIGPRMAERIVAFREKHGGFRNRADLKRIKGIGEKTYAGLVDKISVD